MRPHGVKHAFKGREIKMRSHGPDGRLGVRALKDALGLDEASIADRAAQS